jgi:hypothetical protein
MDIGAQRRQSDDVSGNEPAYFHLETEQQYEALLDFRRALREKKNA